MPLIGSLTSIPFPRGGDVPLAVSTVGIVVLVVVAAIAAMAVTGWVAGRARSRANRDEMMARIRAANTALAQAHAADEGWDRSALEAAAREAARSRGFEDPDALELKLVSVDDRPGVDDDRAVFSLVDGERREDLVLGRAGGAWRAIDG